MVMSYYFYDITPVQWKFFLCVFCNFLYPFLRLGIHWNDLTSMGSVDVAGSFRGVEIFEGWLATGETEQTESGTTSSKRKKKT